MPLHGEIDRKIGARLRERREAIGVSADELADACGLTVAEVLQYEAGSTGLSAAQLCQLADLLEAPMTYFHRADCTSPGLPDPRTGGDLLELFGRLSWEGQQRVMSLALELTRGHGRHSPEA